MSDAYSNVVGGSLKLKGKSGKSGKKRKHLDAEAAPKQASAADEEAADAGAAAAEASVEERAGLDQTAGLTKAQRDFQRAYERNLKRKSNEEKTKTYRDRIAGMNEYLANLSEHHDVPRTSKT